MVRIKTDIREKIMGQTRDALLNSAAEEFAFKGFDQANINDISIKAGFAKGTIYNYFPSKHAVLMELIDNIAQEHLSLMESTILMVDDPVSRLECFFQAGFDYVSQQQNRSRVMFNSVNSFDLKIKEYCFQVYQPMFQLVAEKILAPGIQQGVFRPVDLQKTVILLMTIYLGTASQVDEEGHPWLNSIVVSEFVIHALRIPPKE